MAVQHSVITDPTVYPEEERVGEEMLQRWIAELLRPLLERWLNRDGTNFVGADQFIYYQQFAPNRRYAPDIYVLPGVPPETRVRSWKTWERGVVPSFALEVVSTDWEKDYVESPQRCEEIGIGELIVYDDGYLDRPNGEGARWQVFRAGKKGLWLIERTNEIGVQSRALGCWFLAVGKGNGTRIRIATSSDPATLIPTAEEAERAEKEAERAEKEAERAEKEAALTRVRELEAALARLERERR